MTNLIQETNERTSSKKIKIKYICMYTVMIDFYESKVLSCNTKQKGHSGEIWNLKMVYFFLIQKIVIKN